MCFPKLLVALVCAFFCTGCAAIFDGTSDEVTFNSTPPGATVSVGEQTGTAPCTLKISKKIAKATFSLDGYGEREVEWKRSFGFGWLLMDVLFTPGFGLSGILVDAVSAGWMSHPGVVTCDFTAPPPAAAATKPEQ